MNTHTFQAWHMSIGLKCRLTTIVSLRNLLERETLWRNHCIYESQYLAPKDQYNISKYIKSRRCSASMGSSYHSNSHARPYPVWIAMRCVIGITGHQQHSLYARHVGAEILPSESNGWPVGEKLEQPFGIQVVSLKNRVVCMKMPASYAEHGIQKHSGRSRRGSLFKWIHKLLFIDNGTDHHSFVKISRWCSVMQGGWGNI